MLPLRLRKHGTSGDSAHPLEHALALVPAVRERFGITRIAETTHLDRIPIPVVNAIVPASHDTLSIYSGKGETAAHATVGAVFEAAERQSAAIFEGDAFSCSAASVLRGLDLAAAGVPQSLFETDLPCVTGYDLLNGREIAVPLALVQCPLSVPAITPIVSTNGLAAGITIPEAVYHALFELVERHLRSITHVRAHVWPQFLIARARDNGAVHARADVDDPVAYEIPLPCGVDSIDALHELIASAGFKCRLLAMIEADMPLTVCATISERGEHWGFSGFGCSWSAPHAVTGAITEAVQARNVEIQGVREDLLRERDVVDEVTQHAQFGGRDHRGRWFFDAPASYKALRDLPDCAGSDLMDELRSLLAALARHGCKTVAIVDVTPEDCPIAVVRAIVPELETYVVDRRIGSRMSPAFAL